MAGDGQQQIAPLLRQLRQLAAGGNADQRRMTRRHPQRPQAIDQLFTGGRRASHQNTHGRLRFLAVDGIEDGTRAARQQLIG